jgi:hypothetical protein
MPFVGTGISLGNIFDLSGQPTPTGTIYPLCYSLVRGLTAGPGSEPTFTAVGASFAILNAGTSLTSAYATTGSFYKNALYCYYLAGAEPLSPPSAWGTITPSVLSGASPGYKRWNLAVSGGIVGTSAVFPTTGTFSLQPSGSAAAASIVYPVNLTTPPADVAAYGDNSAFIPGTSTATKGIWVQQVWWVQNAQGTTPALYFNVTHLFTIAGNSTSATLSATPLNTITNVTLSPRVPTAEQGVGDGAFNITLDMPTTVVTTSGSGATPASVRGYTFNASKDYIGADQGTLLDDICTGDVTTGRTFNTTNNGSWVIYLATTNSQATASTCRASNNLLPATGGGNLSSAGIGNNSAGGTNQVGGVFSINPRNNIKTTSFPVDIAYAGNLTQNFSQSPSAFPFTAARAAGTIISNPSGLPVLVYPGNTNDGIVLAG